MTRAKKRTTKTVKKTKGKAVAAPKVVPPPPRYRIPSTTTGMAALIKDDVLEEPVVLITPEADAILNSIQYSGRSDEVSWMMTSRSIDGGSILLDKVFVPAQEVTSVTTSFSSEAMEEVLHEWLESPDIPEGEVMNAWFHLHPKNMGVSPSGRDNDQVADFLEDFEDTFPYFIRGIVNGAGARKIDIYYPKQGVAFHDVACFVDDSEHSAAVAKVSAAIKARASKPAPIIKPMSSFASRGYGNTYQSPAWQQQPPALSDLFDKNNTLLSDSDKSPALSVQGTWECVGLLEDKVYMRHIGRNKEYEVERLSAYGGIVVREVTAKGTKVVQFSREAMNVIECEYDDYLDSVDDDDLYLGGCS